MDLARSGDTRAPASTKRARPVGISGGEHQQDESDRGEPQTRGRDALTGPLSFGQEQIWVHSRLSGDPAAYNEPLTLHRDGPLDEEVLRASLNALVRRHAAWRTSFPERDGEPIAVVSPPAPVLLRTVDLWSLPDDEREDEARRLAAEDARSGFDLAEGPLYRFLLVHFSEEDHRLYMVLHQIIFDGYSMYSVFLPELASIYASLADGRPISLPKLPLSYLEYAQWQRAEATGRLPEELTYWRRQLAEERPPLELPIDHLRPSILSFSGAQFAFRVPDDLATSLRRFARREGATLFGVLLAAYAAFLVRRTGDEMPTIGTVTTTRKRPEVERLLGFFLNTLALRVDLRGDPSFRDALTRARKVLLDGLSNDDVPIHRILREVSNDRDTSRSPLFQTMLVLEPPLPQAPPSWAIGQLDVDAGRSRVELYVEFDDRGAELLGRVRYSTDLFERATVESIVRQLLRFLHSVIDLPDARLSALPLLQEHELSALTSRVNPIAPGQSFERFDATELEEPIWSRFALAAVRHADRTAVVVGNRSASYAELAELSARYAAAVARTCPSGASRVGLLMNPDIDLAAAMLGVLKAGAAYVPLDPDEPPQRLAAIARHAEIGIILAGDELVSVGRRAIEGVPVLGAAEVRRGPAESDERGVLPTPESLAYILYTSGSTGTPKGVAQSQRNLLHHIRVYTNALHISADDCLTLLSRPTFDASVMDIYGALLNGAALQIVDLRRAGFIGLAEALTKDRVTIYHSTPTVFRELVATLSDDERLSGVRLVVLGGEEVRTSDLDAFRRHTHPQSLFVNGYGPTESTLGLQFFADHSTRVERGSVPIGYPVDETEILLLDPNGRPNEFIGEIAVRSRYVALGYWRDPGQTRGVFLATDDGSGPTTYRTGDLARRLDDGSLEFVGRRDGQVKLRGIRIEMGEIEAALRELPGVHLAVVDVRGEGVGRRLVAYLESTAPLDADAARENLRRRFPEYMVPSDVVTIDRLPLTTSGKVDRRALPDPPPRRASQRTGVAADELERRLIGIWEGVLKTRPIGTGDDFFALGGHSLLAARLFDRVWRETGLRLPLSSLLEDATIRHQAELVRRGRVVPSTPLIAIQPNGSRAPLFVVPGVGSRNLYLRNLARHLGSDQPLYALSTDMRSWEPSDRSVENLAAHYIAAMRSVQATGPYCLAGYSFGGVVILEMARQLKAADETIGLLAVIDTRLPGLPRPKSGFHPTHVPRRILNQARILRRLGPREGARYLRNRILIAGDRLKVGGWEYAAARGWHRVMRWLGSDPIPEAEREWARTDIATATAYTLKPYDGPITYLWGRHSQWSARSYDTRLSWARLARGGLDVRPIPGSHLTVLAEPLVRFTAAELLRALAGVLVR